MTTPALRIVADRPETLDDLSVPELAAIVMQASARIAEKAAAVRTNPGLQPLLTVKEAAPLLGLSPSRLRARAKSDPAYRALTVDNGSDKVLFDPAKIGRFRERRAG